MKTRGTIAGATLVGALVAAGLLGGCADRGAPARDAVDPSLTGRALQDGLPRTLVLMGDGKPDPDFVEPGVRDDDPVFVEPPDPSRPDWLADWLDGDDDAGTGHAAAAARGVDSGVDSGVDGDPVMGPAMDGLAEGAADVVPGPAADGTRRHAEAVDALADLDVEALLERLRELRTTMAAFSALSQRPRDELLAPLVAALARWRRSEPPVGDTQRSLAYTLLGRQRPAQDPAGFEALLAGLDDPVGLGTCVQALGHAPPERRDAAVAAITGQLLEPGTRSILRAGAFRALTMLEASDARTRDLARRRLSNPAAPRPERSAAAEHLVFADPDPELLGWLAQATDDAERDELVLGALISKGPRLTQVGPMLPALQALAIAKTGSRSALVRQHALGALLLVFGESALQRDESGALAVHPELARALEAARQREDDDEVRRAIDATIQLLDEALERAAEAG